MNKVATNQTVVRICEKAPVALRYSPRSTAPPNSFAHTQTSCLFTSRGTPGPIGGARRTNNRDQHLIIIATNCSFAGHDPPALVDPGRLLVLAVPGRLLLLFHRAVPPDPAVLVGPNMRRVGKSQAPLVRLPLSLVPPLRRIRFGFSGLVNIHRPAWRCSPRSPVLVFWKQADC